ncbi:PREDICTED: uncharacterized protein LOC109583013 [Amphimedon queenslandica]|nr:PREDICTED: uncharacterized protein LOC109583013 [Amphimedon queenslandica]|eukprot:XP_019853700.1 PREDICTED: uncharacterized protein LOC109583013 [Amphimedon queenslandica]
MNKSSTRTLQAIGHDEGDSSPEEFAIPRAATICTSALRGRRQLSEPPSDMLRDISLSPLPPARSQTVDSKQVGVVKPYAVVDLHETLKQIQSQDHFLRPRVGSCGTVFLYDATKRRIEAPLALQRRERKERKSIVPKRKAPPPPVTRSPGHAYGGRAKKNTLTTGNRMSRSSSVPTPLITDAEEEVHNSSVFIPLNDVSKSKEKSPPCKPPRTQSTYMSFDEVAIGAKTACSDYEPLHRFSQQNSPSGTMRSSITATISSDVAIASLSLLHQFQELFDDTLGNIASRHFEELTSTDQHLQDMNWSDITDSVDLKNKHQLYFHMQPISLEPLDRDRHRTELSIAKTLTPHLNLSLPRGTLQQAPVDYIEFLPDAKEYVVRDTSCLPDKVPLEKILPLWNKSLSEEEYMQAVLLILVQVLRGLNYLYNNGIVHRDIGIESLLAWTYRSSADHCIIKLKNFTYALHRPGPISATTFVFAYDELSWLGGVESHLPPEIVDTPSNVNTLDYSHTDSFAVGCLIHELMTGTSPFDKDPQLVYKTYTHDDLPSISNEIKVSVYLETLTYLLLSRDPLKRLGLGDALLLTQSMLWLPHSWLECSLPKTDIENHLLFLKGKTIAQIAQQDAQDLLALETVLKADFLATCDSSRLVRALAVMNNKMNEQRSSKSQ